MTQSLQLTLKPSFFDSERTLIISPEFLEYNDSNSANVNPTRFNKAEIIEVRHGVKWIKGYSFVIGRIYCIDIKSSTGSVIKIRLKSLYRVRKNQLEEKYKLILNTLFKNFMNDILTDFFEKFNSKIDFEILGVTFTQEGVILEKNSEIISWFDLETKGYWTYCSLFSNSEPNKYKAFQYLTDWNATILFYLTKHIIKTKKF